MDDFNNFFDDQRNNNNNYTPPYHTPDPKPSKEKASKLAPTICIVMAIIMVLAVIINVVVLASIKSTIAQEYAQDMKSSLQEEYYEAISDVLSSKDIVDDVTESAATKAATALSTNAGAIANSEAISVARIYMYTTENADPSTSKYSGLASAFLISDTDETETLQRYLVTNAHCVRYEKSTQTGGFGPWSNYSISYEWTSFGTILAYFENDTNYYTLEVVAYGSYTGDRLKAENDQADLAILRVKGTQPSNTLHPSLKIAESDYTTRGTQIALIGNPEGLGDSITVTEGIVSQSGITISSWGAGTFLMTDAAVNGGNSGGPMVNSQGVVVGIVESKLVDTEIENMGFALSAGTLNDFITWACSGTNNALGTNITINYAKVAA